MYSPTKHLSVSLYHLPAPVSARASSKHFEDFEAKIAQRNEANRSRRKLQRSTDTLVSWEWQSFESWAYRKKEKVKVKVKWMGN